jgi:hypothetical protein
MTRSEHYRCLISRTEGGRILGFEVDAEDLEGGERHVRVNGNRAALVAGPLQEVLRKTGLSGRKWTSPEPLELSSGLGAHVELLLRAVKPLQRTDRITTIAEGVAEMSREEAAYWHAQVQRRHGLQALRILLAGRSR